MAQLNALKNSLSGKRADANECNGQDLEGAQNRYKRLVALGRTSRGIINEICNPIDAVNRFINLTLQTAEENSQTREFLLASKEAIRKTTALLKRLNEYARKIEKELREISTSRR